MDTSVRCAIHLFESTALIYSKVFCCHIGRRHSFQIILSLLKLLLLLGIYFLSMSRQSFRFYVLLQSSGKSSVSNFVNMEGVRSFYPCKIRKCLKDFKGKTQFTENGIIHAAKFYNITGIYVKEQLNSHFKFYRLYTMTEESGDSTCQQLVPLYRIGFKLILGNPHLYLNL